MVAGGEFWPTVHRLGSNGRQEIFRSKREIVTLQHPAFTPSRVA